MPTFSFPVFLLLVFLSGASGLLYEVVWHRYLAILLGAQAWATAIVLAVFLGGLSLGYFLFGLLSRSPRRKLLLFYALIELGLAVWAFAFPYFYQLAFKVTPYLYQVFGVTHQATDLFIAIVLLGFPTVLMGGTLPLLTQALSPSSKEASSIHSKIYGFNTIGACFGCLAAGYWLIPSYGLTATIWVGAAINALVFLGSVGLWRLVPAKGISHKASSKALQWRPGFRDALILFIGFVSGFVLISLQSVLIRLLGLASGASNYSFALVVAIFVFCLGVGSLIARRIDGYSPERLFWNQLFAAVGLMLLYFSGDYWSYGVHLIRILFRDLPQAFPVYQMMIGVSLLAVLFIPLALCGLTLPLCFHLVKGQSEGLGLRVGYLYGINTVGCIAGALIGGHWVLHYLNLDQVFKLDVFLVILTTLAAAYFANFVSVAQWGQKIGASALGALVLTGVWFAPSYHKERFLQPFRQPRPLSVSFSGANAFGAHLSRTTKLLLWKDGPNTSVGIGASQYEGKEVSRTIFVNGKSDGNTRGDLLTTIMLGHLPALFTPKPSQTCVIGFGTGMTVGALLNYPQVNSIDVVDISGTILGNASLFDIYNGAVSRSPKVHFHEMDAVRFLGARKEPFDTIVSEPSNPWVAGVENLFSQEFYQRVRASLAPQGVFVQWLHTYSFTDDLFRTILATLGREFPYVSVFQLKGGDYALVASLAPLEAPAIAAAHQRYLELPSVREDLAQAGVSSFETLLALEVMHPEAVRQVSQRRYPPHTLLKPKLSDSAARAFFAGASFDFDAFRREQRTYFQYLDETLLQRYLNGRSLTATQLSQFEQAFCRESQVKMDYLCRETLLLRKLKEPSRQATGSWVPDQGRFLASIDLFRSSSQQRFGEKQLQEAYDRFDAFKKYASGIFYLSENRLLKPVDQCLHSVSRTSEVWGQCLLQKILVLEWLKSSDSELLNAKTKYVDWFKTLPPTASNYTKLNEAKQILEKMLNRAY